MAPTIKATITTTAHRESEFSSTPTLSETVRGLFRRLPVIASGVDPKGTLLRWGQPQLLLPETRGGRRRIPRRLASLGRSWVLSLMMQKGNTDHSITFAVQRWLKART